MSIFLQAYHSLLVWQKADDFVTEVYKTVLSFPKEELFGVISQLRRAALSIALNIVEGHARGSQKEFVRFLIIARASNRECAYILEFCKKVGYLKNEQYENLENKRRLSEYFIQKTIDKFTPKTTISTSNLKPPPTP